MSLWDHISDDAYISFRYVERWVAGQGLTFNPGEQVEGFSNPLWVGILALSRFLLPNVAIVDAARVLGFAASVISFLAMAVAVKLSSPGRQSVAFLYAAVILACTPGFHVYATAGLETPVFGMLVTVAVLFSLAETLPPHRAGVRGGDPGFAARLGAALCLGFAAVCRPEAALYGLLWWLFTRGPRQLRMRPGHELTVMAALSAPFLGYEAFRVTYFGELLPNTFLAKPPGIFGGIFGISYLLQWAIALGGPLLFVVWLLRRAPLESEAGRLLRASAGPLRTATAARW